jgi:hypothetical protein
MSGEQPTNSTDDLDLTQARPHHLELFLFACGIFMLLVFIVLEICSNVPYYLDRLYRSKRFKISGKVELKTGEIF